MAKRTPLSDDSCPFDTDSEPSETVTPIDGDSPLSVNNAEKLTTALDHLRKLFVQATLPQIGNRPFYGITVIRLRWFKGECVAVNTTLRQIDKGRTTYRKG